MEELYSIMRDFLEVEYNQKSLLLLLTAVEAAEDNTKQAETKFIVNSTKYYLKALQKELGAAINRLDSYMTEKTEER
jgi:hypothetical protein